MTDHSRFERILTSLPEVAKAVNAFSSEAAQLKVLDAVLAALDIPAPASAQVAPPPSATDSGVIRSATRAKSSSGKKDPDPKIVADLNLRPAGKASLRDFVQAKSPGTNEELYAVIIHYLEHTLSLSAINVDHVFTSLKDLGRKISPRLRTVLSNSASSKGWIDTANRDKIRTTVPGQNLVEHDLPRPKSK